MIRALKGLDLIANCAAYYPTLPKPLTQEIKTARLQMQFFLDGVEASGCKRALYVGGAIAIPKNANGLGKEDLFYDKAPENQNPYLQVKWLMDEMTRMSASKGLPLIIGIPTMTFGEYDYGPTTGRLIVDLANQELPAYITGLRNVVSARDAGRGLLLALEKGRFGERYLISGENTDIGSLVNLISETAGVTTLTKTLPLGLAKLISKLQEIRYILFKGTAPSLSSTAIAVLSSGQHIDGTKSKDELGYEPDLSAKDAVRSAYNWFKKEGYIE
jgi:nucleoside-diphosphate-sugar epimerase